MKKRTGIILVLMVSAIATLIFCGSCNKDYQYQSNTGTGGSMTRFTIAKNHLYIVDNKNLKVFDIMQSNNPVFVTELNVGESIETIFPNNNYLFIGSNNGMYIYDITTPQAPVYVTEITHMISCDPVVVNDSLAFITLHSGSDCHTSNGSNQLEVLDITNINNPVLLQVYPMDSPYGLATDSCYLFICHSTYGLGVYNFSNPDSIYEISHINDIETYDVIPYQKRLMVIGPDGFYQYSYAQIDSIYLISQLLKGD